MTGSDASPSEMPTVPFHGQVGRDHQDELLLDMILDRRPLPPSAPPGILALADKLVGLAAPPGAGELPGEAAALAAFLRSGSLASTLVLAGEPPRQPRGRRFLAGRVRLSAAVAVVTVCLSGTAAAAYAGALPASVQNLAHSVIDAPAARHAAHHGHDAPGQRGGHPGVMRSSPPAPGSGHPAKPGKEKAHRPRHHRRQHGTPAKGPKPTPTHPAHSARPASTPSPSHLAVKTHPTGPQGQPSR
jgi:hypothetical protein